MFLAKILQYSQIIFQIRVRSMQGVRNWFRATVRTFQRKFEQKIVSQCHSMVSPRPNSVLLTTWIFKHSFVISQNYRPKRSPRAPTVPPATSYDLQQLAREGLNQKRCSSVTDWVKHSEVAKRHAFPLQNE